MRHLSLGAVRHAVIVAPHSDDEAIAAFFTLQALRRRGARVDVIVVTDGAASHRNSPGWSRPRLIAERRRETRAAMARAGVPRHRITFLGLPDGGLDSLPQARFRIAVRHLQRRPTPDLVIMPGARDAHPDHRDVHAMCRAAWPPAIRRLCYVVWPDHDDEIGDRPARARAVGRLGDPRAKRSVMACYRSQMGAIRDDPDGFALTGAMLRRMCPARETFTC